MMARCPVPCGGEGQRPVTVKEDDGTVTPAVETHQFDEFPLALAGACRADEQTGAQRRRATPAANEEPTKNVT